MEPSTERILPTGPLKRDDAMKGLRLSLPLKAGLTLLILAALGTALHSELRHRPDGSVEYTTADGKTKVVSMDGKTPYGATIAEKKQTLRRRNFRLELIYSAALSDDLLEGTMKIFYTELYNRLHRLVYRDPLPRHNRRVVISNCRHCRTGHCRRINKKGIHIIIYEKEKKLKQITVDHEKLLDRKKLNAVANRVAIAALAR